MMFLRNSQKFQNLNIGSYFIGLIVILIVLFSINIHASEPSIRGKINITVKDNAGLPLPGALLQLTIPDGSVRSLQTDRNGTAIFSNLNPGNYQINVSIEGFESLNQSITLKD